MEQKLIYLLHDKDQPWFRQITSASIHALVNCIRETNDMFMRSKIALRSRIISLYANNDASGKISPVRRVAAPKINLTREPDYILLGLRPFHRNARSTIGDSIRGTEQRFRATTLQAPDQSHIEQARAYVPSQAPRSLN